ncbi:MAG: hypothetical protein H6563_11790 [Lewinellaceae bacterium]|nr:hypothetical protein [Lewinellaceae bacterium]
MQKPAGTCSSGTGSGEGSGSGSLLQAEASRSIKKMRVFFFYLTQVAINKSQTISNHIFTAGGGENMI